MMSILLTNATILVPRGAEDDHVVHLKNHSLLIEGSKISRIAPDIEAPSSSTEVIDCTGKLISPGFVDTHHHVWQTQVKGRHADHTLLEYMAPGNMVSHSYTPEEVLWGQLGGLLEAVNAGTTTVVDHAHISYSPAHNTAALSGTISSGVRSVYCYCPIARVKSWKPFELEQDLVPDWFMEQLEALGKAAPFGNGRVTMGFGFDFFFLPQQVVVSIFERVRALGLKTITSHYVGSIFPGSTVDLLESYGLLDKDILLSHATPLSDSDAQKLRKAGASISSTPDTELQMSHGWPVCFQENASSISSLGIDCHSNQSGSLVGQMRVGIQAERARRNDKVLGKGKFPIKISLPVQEAFQLGTIRGARAIKMEDQIGSLEEGKIADIVIFDALSPSMICAAEEDPVGAIVLHSSVADVEAVIVDGQVRKRDGKLVTTKMDFSLAPELNREKLEWTWADIAAELIKGRNNILEADQRSGADDRENAMKEGLKMYHLPEEKLVS